MFKFVIILIVTRFMVTVCEPEFYNKDAFPTLRHSKRALAELATIEALPFVFILRDQGTEEETLYSPDDITRIAVKRGKMVGGTQFSLWGSNLGTQMFFCPAQHPDNSQETCLAHRDFQPSEKLKCAQEPTPEVVEDKEDETHECGFANAGIHHIVGFSICPPERPYHYKINFLGIYGFCYVEGIEKILFTSHLILHPKLLDTNLLCREHELSFPYHRDETYPTADYNDLYKEEDSSLTSLKPNYVVQHLVPTEDMPFGIWKTTINQSFNVELQHKDLFHIWNDINFKVRNAAIEEAKKDNPVKFYIRTAVIPNNVDVPLYGTQQIYNTWFKMVIAKSEQNIAVSGVVVLMNNFIGPQMDFHGNEYANLYDEMQEFCRSSLCANRLQSLVETIGGRIKCCLVTPKIAELLGYYGGVQGLLKISGLTIR